MHNIDYNGKEVLTFSFEEIEAVAFRVTGNCARNEGSENFRLMELEAYYYPDMPSELITGTKKYENESLIIDELNIQNAILYGIMCKNFKIIG